MKLGFYLAPLLTLSLTCVTAQTPPPALPDLMPPPQDQGLPYTRSANSTALAEIKEGVAIAAGSRYGFIQGHRVRLDENDLLHAEAFLKEGKLYVPWAFVLLLQHESELTFPAIPPDLTTIADRWVDAPSDLWPGLKAALTQPAPSGSVQVQGDTYVPVVESILPGQHLTDLGQGLFYFGEHAVKTLAARPTAQRDSLVALFDTPEKYENAGIAPRSIPVLIRQGTWTDHIKVTPAQLAVLQGPEKEWPVTPKSAYDLSGFNTTLLGSPVPAPGVYPRVLFSPEDVPALAARVKSTRVGQMSLIEMETLFKKTWWNPATPDGQVFQQLATGQLDGLVWDNPPGTPAGNVPHLFKGQKSGIFTHHVWYNEQCLTTMALYCLLTNDDVHGRQVAAAVANYYKLREPLLDEVNSLSDSEFGSGYQRAEGSFVAMDGFGAVGHWRSMGNILGGGIGNHMDLGLALDFSGKWMTDAEKDAMRRFIAKATYGTRPYGQDGPRRWRDINWVTWDLSSYLALASIEGLPGFDREAFASEKETVHSFLEFGINDDGVIYESNGKTPGGLQFLTLAMVGMARRDDNCFGHPHWRKFLAAQVASTSPTGQVIINSGTQYSPYSRQHLSYQFLLEMKSFFPQLRTADYLLDTMASSGSINGDYLAQATQGQFGQPFNPDLFRAALDKDSTKVLLPGPTFPGFAPGVIFDSDYEPTTRADLQLPLDFNSPAHGLFSSYSDSSPQAAWINLLVRPDHYLGAGHHHADAGMFHFSALGVDWFTQSPFSQSYDGKYFNLVQVDGHSEPESIKSGVKNPIGGINGYNGRATYLGAVTSDSGAAAAADLTYAYSYRWMTQPPKIWDAHLAQLGWELEPNPEVLQFFIGTSRYKMRPWWPSPNMSNYIPTCRAPFNPMKYVDRTTALVRGKHPYALVLDDVAKGDGQDHLYQWAAMLNGGVQQAEIPGLTPSELVLAYRKGDPEIGSPQLAAPVSPQPGEPLLLVRALNLNSSGKKDLPILQVERATGLVDAKGNPQYYDRLVINQQGLTASYRVLLLPFSAGEALPDITWSSGPENGAGSARLTWPDQPDTLLTSREAGAASLKVTRGSETILKAHFVKPN